MLSISSRPQCVNGASTAKAGNPWWFSLKIDICMYFVNIIFCCYSSVIWSNAFVYQGTAGIILCIHPANERWRYNVTSSLIGWAHTQNDPWNWVIQRWWLLVCVMSTGINTDIQSISAAEIHFNFNPLHAIFSEINIYLHFMSFLTLIRYR